MRPQLSQSNDDCLRACVASLLELELEEVPHFLTGPEDRWALRLQRFLDARGCWALIFHNCGIPVQGYSIGVYDDAQVADQLHAVVMLNEQPTWDPRGLTNPQFSAKPTYWICIIPYDPSTVGKKNRKLGEDTSNASSLCTSS